MLILRLALATVFFFQLNLVAGGQVIGWGTFYSSTITNDPPDDLGDVVALAGGTYTSLALRSDGTVASWGPELAPPGLSNITAISAGGGFYLALQTNGTIVAWGRNDHGQTNVPSDLTNVVAISASMTAHALALRSDGTVTNWGWYNVANPALATVPASATNVMAIAAGSNHDLVLRRDGTVVAWGANDAFSNFQATVPAGLSNVIAIAAGGQSSIALKSDGSVVSWGYWSSFQPVLTNVVAISAGYTHCLALHRDRTVTAWGPRDWDGPGMGTVPPGLSNVIAIASAPSYDLFLLGPSEPFALDSGQFGIQPSIGAVTIGLRGSSGQHAIRVHASMDLLHWDPVWTNSAAAGVIQLIDAGAIGAPQRYYRLEEMK